MFSFLKLFVRSIRRNRLFASINILGLTVGFFASAMIYLYVENEVSYDQFHENGDRIYRINQTFIWGDDNPNLFSSTGPGVAYAIVQEIPEVEQVVRIHTTDLSPVRFDSEGKEQFFKDERIFAVDTNFLEVFTFPLRYGNERTALAAPNSVVLSAAASKRFFGNENPVGRMIDIGGGPLRKTYQVTGVLKENPNNTYIGDFDLLLSMASIDRVARSNWSWMWTTFETFVLLENDASVSRVKKKLNLLPRKHADQTLKVMGYTYDEYIAAGKEWNLYLQPLEDIYLKSTNIYNRLSGVGSYKIVIALVGSAIFLVILSCINFINLSTAQFTSRAKDVALRKVLGGSNGAFRKRFFSESLLYCLISATLAMGLVIYTIPLLNQVGEMELSLEKINLTLFSTFLAMLILVVSAISGLFPFAFFNRFKPIAAMKGELKTGKGGLRTRNGMLIAQYALSFLLLICTLTVFQQLQHFLRAEVGFDKERLMSVENVLYSGSSESFAEELRNVEGVEAVALCDAAPMLFVENGDQFQPDIPGAGSVPLNFALGDENYLPMLGIEMMVGRVFDDAYGDDVNAVVLNETAARTIGWTVDEGILNKKISNYSGTYHVIGVARDFNFWSLQAPIEPFAVFHAGSNAASGRPMTRALVRTSAGSDFKQINEDLKQVWQRFSSNVPYESMILDQQFRRAYQTEERFGKVLSFFAMLTIIIASLGLLGIIVFAVEQKLKEIGVRKVLGASASSLIMLFSRSYVKLLMIAFLIAAPLGYQLMENWLSDFEYRIALSPGIFGAALLILLLISVGISTIYTLKASLLNPAEVLKDE